MLLRIFLSIDAYASFMIVAVDDFVEKDAIVSISFN
jgi:hypothetical protein